MWSGFLLSVKILIALNLLVVKSIAALRKYNVHNDFLPSEDSNYLFKFVLAKIDQFVENLKFVIINDFQTLLLLYCCWNIFHKWGGIVEWKVKNYDKFSFHVWFNWGNMWNNIKWWSKPKNMMASNEMQLYMCRYYYYGFNIMKYDGSLVKIFNKLLSGFYDVKDERREKYWVYWKI